jgi:hypothetical protein
MITHSCACVCVPFLLAAGLCRFSGRGAGRASSRRRATRMLLRPSASTPLYTSRHPGRRRRQSMHAALPHAAHATHSRAHAASAHSRPAHSRLPRMVHCRHAPRPPRPRRSARQRATVAQLRAGTHAKYCIGVNVLAGERGSGSSVGESLRAAQFFNNTRCVFLEWPY